MRVIDAKTGFSLNTPQTTHEANDRRKHAIMVKAKRASLMNNFSISLNRLMVVKVLLKRAIRFSISSVRVSEFCARKFLVHLRTVYASLQKLARPLKNCVLDTRCKCRACQNHSICSRHQCSNGHLVPILISDFSRSYAGSPPRTSALVPSLSCTILQTKECAPANPRKCPLQVSFSHRLPSTTACIAVCVTALVASVLYECLRYSRIWLKNRCECPASKRTPKTSSLLTGSSCSCDDDDCEGLARQATEFNAPVGHSACSSPTDQRLGQKQG